MAKRLALVRVRDVQLDDRRLDHVERIEDRHRRMGERRRVDDDAVGAVDAALDPVDDLRLAVRLVERDRQAALVGARPAHFLDLLERGRAVDVRLARAEQVEVRTVENQDRLAHAFLRKYSRVDRTSSASRAPESRSGRWLASGTSTP